MLIVEANAGSWCWPARLACWQAEPREQGRAKKVVDGLALFDGRLIANQVWGYYTPSCPASIMVAGKA